MNCYSLSLAHSLIEISLTTMLATKDSRLVAPNARYCPTPTRGGSAARAYSYYPSFPSHNSLHFTEAWIPSLFNLSRIHVTHVYVNLVLFPLLLLQLLFTKPVASPFDINHSINTICRH